MDKPVACLVFAQRTKTVRPRPPYFIDYFEAWGRAARKVRAVMLFSP